MIRQFSCFADVNVALRIAANMWRRRSLALQRGFTGRLGDLLGLGLGFFTAG